MLHSNSLNILPTAPAATLLNTLNCSTTATMPNLSAWEKTYKYDKTRFLIQDFLEYPITITKKSL